MKKRDLINALQQADPVCDQNKDRGQLLRMLSFWAFLLTNVNLEPRIGALQ